MKGAAEPPADPEATANPPADPEATANPRPGREPEGATFASAPVPGRRGLQSFLVLGFLAVLGGIVVAAVGGRTDAGRPVIAPLALGSPAAIGAVASLGATPSELPPGPGFTPVFPLEGAPMVTSGPGPVQLQANRQSASIFVHGDVFVEHVTWVFVSFQDDAGRVAGWASVSVPGAAGSVASSGPSLRFDVDLAVPATVSGTLSVVANAYDTSGQLIASTRLEVRANAAGPTAGAAIPTAGTIPASGRAAFDFEVRRDGNDIFVLGTVRDRNVDSIVMALRDETGRATE